MSRLPPKASGYFRTSFAQELSLFETHTQKATFAALAILLWVFPFVATPLQLEIVSQIFLATIGSLALMLLTGFAGQISLGHAGLIAAGAFTTGILAKELHAPFWITVPASAVVGALLGLVFGLPALRLRGLYLAISTLALYFFVIYLGGEYETRRGFSTGIVVDPPRMGSVEIASGRAWYVVMLIAAAAALFVSVNLLRSRTGRAWRAIQTRETVAEALGIGVARAKLSAFVISSAMTALAGCLFAYYRNFVSVEAFSLFLSIQYVAMIIIGGMGSLLGAVLGAIFVTLLPYVIEGAVAHLPNGSRYASLLFAFNYAAFGLVTILFLMFEPLGLVGVWQRIQSFFLLWPFKSRPATGGKR